MIKGRIEENQTELDRLESLLDGSVIDVVDATTLKIGGTQITATAAEINAACDGDKTYVKVTDAATYTVLAANSGKLHIMPDLTADCTITLPTPADGLRFKFIYGGVAQDAHDWNFDTGSDTNYFLGGLTGHDTDAGGSQNYVVYPDGDSNSKCNILTPGGGTEVEFICDGTLWYLHGDVVSSTDTAVTFADQ